MPMHENERVYACVACGGDLTVFVKYKDGHERYRDGRPDKRTCSASCRAKEWRKEQGRRPVDRDCILCGEPFTPRNGFQRMCNYDADASDYCQEMQDDRDDVAAASSAVLADRKTLLRCEHRTCGKRLSYSGRGRLPRYCSPAHRMAAIRAEAKGGAA